jgi:hypothetical protein
MGFSHAHFLIIFENGGFGHQNTLMPDLLFSSLAMTDHFEEDLFKAPHNSHKLKRPIRVRGGDKFYQRYVRQLLISGRYNIIDLTYIREERNRSCIYYKKGRHFCVFIDFSRVSQEFRKLILY